LNFTLLRFNRLIVLSWFFSLFDLAFAKKPLTECKKRVASTVGALDPQLLTVALATKIEHFLSVKSEAGRMGFAGSGASISLSARESAEVASLLVQSSISFDQFKTIFTHFGDNHPTGSTQEWLRAIQLAVHLEIDPIKLSQELETLYKTVQLVDFHDLSFGKVSEHGKLRFSEVLDIWLLSRQLSMPPKKITGLVNTVQSEFPGETLEDTFDLLMWQHLSGQKFAKIKEDLDWIKENFRLTTRRSIGFSSEPTEIRLSFEQALVIQKMAVISATSLEVLLDQFNQVAVAKNVQEVEDIVSPIRESVQTTLDEMMK
jgi:hypothetical protein